MRLLAVAVAAVAGLDALQEYIPLVTHAWGVPTSLIPLATLGIPLAGAVGAALAGAATRARPLTIAFTLGAVGVILATAAVVHHPFGVAIVALSYGLYHMVLVAVDARLQARIEGRSRATVTSVAALGSEVTVFAVYMAWALGGMFAVAMLVCAIAVLLPVLLPATGGGWVRRS